MSSTHSTTVSPISAVQCWTHSHGMARPWVAQSSSSTFAVALLFDVQPDQKQLSVLRALADLAMRRRAKAPAEGEPRPLMICVVSREKGLGDEELIKAAEECNGVVEAEDLDQSHTAGFVDHLMSTDQRSDTSPSSEEKASEANQSTGDTTVDAETKRRKVLAEYLYTMTGGNPNTLQSMFNALESSKVIRKLPDGSRCIDAAYEDIEALKKLEVPESLGGVAFSFFERLDPIEQTVLKALSACANDVGGLHELTAALPSIGMDKIQGICHNLTQPASRALRREEKQLKKTLTTHRSSISGNSGYRFYSGLLRHAVSMLVLEKQRTEVRRNCSQAAVSELNFIVPTARSSLLEEGGIRLSVHLEDTH